MIKLWFNKRGGMFGWLIKLFSGKYCHVELEFSDGMSFSALPSGVRFARLSYQPGQWDCLEIPCEEEDEDLVRAAAEFISGADYDFAGILHWPFPFIKEDDSRWFCSEAVCQALQVGGMLGGLRPSKTSPTRLYFAAKKLIHESTHMDTNLGSHS